MKSTGIIRQIDELGRIVIPIEIRRAMKLNCNDEIEIYTEDGGKIVLKKYSPFGKYANIASQYIESINAINNILFWRLTAKL